MCYLASMTRHKRRGQREHQQCSETDRCNVHDLGDTTFIPTHVSEGCGCETLTMPENEMMDIIERDGIPLIVCEVGRTNSTNTDVSFAMVEHKRGMNYTAISHVSRIISLGCQ